jgi:hypothetical protein
MMFLKILVVDICPSPLLVQLGRFPGHSLVPKKFLYQNKNLDYIWMVWTNFQPWHAIFSYLNKSLLSSILFLPMPDFEGL